MATLPEALSLGFGHARTTHEEPRQRLNAMSLDEVIAALT